MPDHPADIAVTSSAFAEGAAIPSRFSCEGADVSPALSLGSLPNGTQSLAIIVEDPDAPSGTFTHWLLWNLPPTQNLTEGADVAALGARVGTNDFGNRTYQGPCPPPGAPHHYLFRVFALDASIDLAAGAKRTAFYDAVTSHELGQGQLTGTFQRS